MIGRINWELLSPESYYKSNYARLRDDDAMLLRWTAEIVSREPYELSVLDVGTGTNLYPALASLPRAKVITLCEYSTRMTYWLMRALDRQVISSGWQSYWEIIRKAYVEELPSDPQALLSERARVVSGSIYDLPEAQWELATMFFCAESISSNSSEFERACRSFLLAIKPGGRFVAAFMAGSRGYDVGSLSFPAVAIDADALEATLGAMCTNLEIRTIQRSSVGERALREGYSGFLFASGIRVN